MPRDSDKSQAKGARVFALSSTPDVWIEVEGSSEAALFVNPVSTQEFSAVTLQVGNSGTTTSAIDVIHKNLAAIQIDGATTTLTLTATFRVEGSLDNTTFHELDALRQGGGIIDGVVIAVRYIRVKIEVPTTASDSVQVQVITK